MRRGQNWVCCLKVSDGDTPGATFHTEISDSVSGRFLNMHGDINRQRDP